VNYFTTHEGEQGNIFFAWEVFFRSILPYKLRKHALFKNDLNLNTSNVLVTEQGLKSEISVRKAAALTIKKSEKKSWEEFPHQLDSNYSSGNKVF